MFCMKKLIFFMVFIGLLLSLSSCTFRRTTCKCGDIEIGSPRKWGAQDCYEACNKYWHGYKMKLETKVVTTIEE